MSPQLSIGTRALLLRGGGAVLMIAGLGLAALTERSLLLHHQAALRHGGDVVALGEGGRHAGVHDGMVLVSGTPDVAQPPRDPDFGVSVPTTALVRHVEMFQWREVRIGEDVHYEMDWSDSPQDSVSFVQPRGHANPRAFPVQARRFDAGEVRLGGYVLGPVLTRALPGSEPVPPDAGQLPANLAASFGVDGNYLTTSAHPESPQLGDLRVSWEAVPLQPVTVLARLDGDRLVRADEADDGQGFQVQIGRRSLGEVLPDVPEPPEFTIVRRAGGILLAALGAMLLLWERRRRAADLLLALGIGATAVGAVSSASWLGGGWRPVLAWCGVSVAGALVVVALYGRNARRVRA